MSCLAYCTALSYEIKPFYDFIKDQYKAALYREVVHVDVSTGDKIKDIFYFSYGAVVFWGLEKQECVHFLDMIKRFESHPLEEIETDEFTFVIGDAPKILEDEIILPDRDILTRLAISHGLAQSVKLGTFEIALHRTYTHTKYIPEDLASRGRVSLSRKEIRRKMGELFLERNSINLHVDVLDVPEFFWEYPELEPLYSMTAKYLDLSPRVEVLNHRLDVVHELFEMLGNELNHQHSSRLEWTIIWLIIIEVALSLLRDVFRVL